MPTGMTPSDSDVRRFVVEARFGRWIAPWPTARFEVSLEQLTLRSWPVRFLAPRTVASARVQTVALQPTRGVRGTAALLPLGRGRISVRVDDDIGVFANVRVYLPDDGDNLVRQLRRLE